MQITRVRIHNFRLLSDAEMALEKETTLVVGRNNSGKTSLSEVMRRFFEKPNPDFRIEDFSISCYESFCEALSKHLGDEDEGKEQAVRELLPCIELRVQIGYDPTEPLGPLSEFIINLDPACTEAVIVFSYELKDGAIKELFADQDNPCTSDEEKKALFKILKERVPTLFSTKVWAEDPSDSTNRKDVGHSEVRSLIRTGFINAQRGLDDVTTREADILAKTLEGLFTTALSPNASDKDKQIADDLKLAVEGIQSKIDTDFSGRLKELIPTFETFGYPGLQGPEIQTETILDITKLLSNHTKIQYAGHNGVALPEAYNGLGIRNLLFILLQIIGFFRAYQAEPKAPGIHLVFVEEPEAHLHPQMQEVFIRQLSAIAQFLSQEEGAVPWPAQFVVSTHSSHISNAAGFKCIRYFLRRPDNALPGFYRAAIKDLRNNLHLADSTAEEFLHKYLTLTKCDLFFADKAVLVEGLTERLLLPVIAGKLELQNPGQPKLSTQYISVLEVGGAYAHLFFPLLEFLELPYLVITDIDSIGADSKACAVHQGTSTSNACIKKWFEGETCSPANLLAKDATMLIREASRIAYQQPEEVGGPCGRSFEDMFVLANSTLFPLAGTAAEEQATEAWELASKFDKSDFALKYAIEETTWNIPAYIVDGLTWLASVGGSPEQPKPEVGLEITNANAQQEQN